MPDYIITKGAEEAAAKALFLLVHPFGSPSWEEWTTIYGSKSKYHIQARAALAAAAPLMRTAWEAASAEQNAISAG